MKAVHCKNCGRVVGQSDGKAFFKDMLPVNQLSCVCGSIRKLFGKRQRPEPMIFSDVSFSMRLT
jgi:hypothetical protein